MRKIAMWTAFAFLLHPNTSLAAEWWEGTWSDSPDASSCHAERGDGYPLIVMSTGKITEQIDADEGQILMERQADPIACTITKTTGVADLDAWIFNISCEIEGDLWESRTIAMKTDVPDGLAAYNLEPEGGVKQLYRCSE